MPKVVVTGGAGFIGSHLVDELLDQGYKVIVLDDLSTGRLSNLQRIDDIELYGCDVTRSPLGLAAIIKGAECVFHLAAKTSVQESLEYPDLYTQTNVVGTASMLEACRLAGVKRFVFSSTSAIYGNTNVFPTTEDVNPSPISPYALSKLIGENYCKFYSEVYGISTVCLRYFNVYGNRVNPNGSYRSVIPVFIEQRLAGKPLTITNDGHQARDFVNVVDVAKANIAAMQFSGKGHVINIGSGTSVSVNQIAEIIGGKTENVGFRLEPKVSLASIERAKSILNWNPSGDVKAWIKDQIA